MRNVSAAAQVALTRQAWGTRRRTDVRRVRREYLRGTDADWDTGREGNCGALGRGDGAGARETSVFAPRASQLHFEVDDDVAHADFVAGTQGDRARDSLVIEIGAVGAVEVGQHVPARSAVDAGVVG